MSIKMQKLVFNPFSSANILACFAFEEMLIASCDLFFGVHSNNVIEYPKVIRIAILISIIVNRLIVFITGLRSSYIDPY